MKNDGNCARRHVVLLRHGESVWNRDNLFSGWSDVDGSERARQEGREAGRSLKELGFAFDMVDLNIPTVILLAYEPDEDLHPLRHDYLGDAARVQQAVQAVAKHASTKPS